jgi:hypothetical protein
MLRGQYRIVLMDKYDCVGYIAVIRGLLPNQWNHFTIHMNTNFAPARYRILVHQTGFYPDTFYLDNVKVEHLTTAWEISPNNGTNWFPLLTAKGQYSGINFISQPGQQLKLKAIALTDQSWISEYELVPHVRHTYPLGQLSGNAYGIGTYGIGSYGDS